MERNFTTGCMVTYPDFSCGNRCLYHINFIGGEGSLLLVPIVNFFPGVKGSAPTINWQTLLANLWYCFGETISGEL